MELTIDGRKVGDAVLSPEFSDLNRRVLYISHDVTSLFSKGVHTFDAVLGNGQHSPVEHIGADEADNIVVSGGKGAGYHNRWGRFGGPKFLLELEVEYADGTREFFGTDETWRWSDGPITFNDLWRGEKQDLRITPTNWNPVALFPAPPGRMEVSSIPPVRKPLATLTEANQRVKSGDTVFIRGGKYALPAKQTIGVELSQSGEAGKPIQFFAYTNETPVLDGSALAGRGRIVGLLISGDWIHVRGLEVCNVPSRGTSYGIWIKGAMRWSW